MEEWRKLEEAAKEKSQSHKFPHTIRQDYSRRSGKKITVVPRSYIVELIRKVDSMKYGYSIKGSLSPTEQKLRNKCLIALLYLSGRRISELTGRVATYENQIDEWEGVFTEDFTTGQIEDEGILRMKYRVLKRGYAKSGLKVVMAFVDIRLSDPLSQHVTEWLRYLKHKGYEKVFNISRQRCWQIVRAIDPNIWNHWFRHIRLTHISDTMNPWELKEFAKFARLETALAYVHQVPVKILTKVREADKLWK